MIEIIQAICPHTDFTNEDCVKEIAFTWMKLLDEDNSGQINFKEFEQSFNKINVIIYPSQIQQIFDQIDEGKNGLISLTELGQAVKGVIDSYQLLLENGELNNNKEKDDFDDYGLETQRN